MLIRLKQRFYPLKNNKSDYAVLPIENSDTGTIVDVMDLLEKYGYFIIGEVDIPIRHCLMGVKGSKVSDIKYIYSHEQGIMQSSGFLKTLGNDIICRENTIARLKVQRKLLMIIIRFKRQLRVSRMLRYMVWIF